MSQVLRQSTQFVVRIGPAVAVADGFTPVTTLDLSTADEAELLKAAGAATVSIAAATFAAIAGADGWYDLTLTTSHTDTVGTLDVVVNDDSLILPIFARFQVVEEAAYDAIYAASASPATTAGAIGSVTGAVGSVAAGGITAASLAADCITAAKVAADVSAEIADAVWDEDATGHQVTGTFGQAIGDPVADTATIFGGVVRNAAGVDIAADILTLDNLVDDLESRLGTPSDLGGGATVAANLADIEAQTDDIGAAGAGLTALATQASVNTIDGIVDDILLDTAEIGVAGAGLTNINLPNQTMDITGDITGNLSGSVGSVSGAVGSVTGAVGSVTAPVSVAAGQFFVKKNTELANFEFVMFDSTDHITPKTGLTVAVQASKDGAAFANVTNTPATEVSAGVYKITLSTTDLNVTTVMLKATATDADNRYFFIVTQA